MCIIASAGVMIFRLFKVAISQNGGLTELTRSSIDVMTRERQTADVPEMGLELKRHPSISDAKIDDSSSKGKDGENSSSKDTSIESQSTLGDAAEYSGNEEILESDEFERRSRQSTKMLIEEWGLVE